MGLNIGDLPSLIEQIQLLELLKNNKATVKVIEELIEYDYSK